MQTKWELYNNRVRPTCEATPLEYGDAQVAEQLGEPLPEPMSLDELKEKFEDLVTGDKRELFEELPHLLNDNVSKIPKQIVTDRYGKIVTIASLNKPTTSKIAAAGAMNNDTPFGPNPPEGPHDVFSHYEALGGNPGTSNTNVPLPGLQEVIDDTAQQPHVVKLTQDNIKAQQKPHLKANNVDEKLYAMLKLRKPDVAVLKGMVASPDLIALANQICDDEKWHPDPVRRLNIIQSTVSAVLVPTQQELARYRQVASNKGYKLASETARLRKGDVSSGGIINGLPLMTRAKRMLGIRTIVSDPMRLNDQH